MTLSTIAGVEEIISSGLVRSVYQPVVDIDSGAVVGFEALARGPQGSELEAPDRLFEAAGDAGLTAELDWECRGSALHGALAAGLDRRTLLFINAEPVTFGRPRPERFDEVVERAGRQLNVVVEFTERRLADDPGSLVAMLSQVRGLGFAVALDDVGANPASLAFMPILAPDVVKLDLALVKGVADGTTASISAAVRADAELRGVVLLAEGIESPAHEDRAVVLGASLGQGWMYGRPGDLDREVATRPTAYALPRRTSPVPESPWALVAESPARRRATKRLLIPMSRHIEEHPRRSDDRPVLLAAFQDAQHFTTDTMKRYAELATRCSFVGALGVGMTSTPVIGVRGASFDGNVPLAGEWAVIVIGPHHAAALLAKDLGDSGPDSDRRFDYVITHDRDLVAAAARSLMQHLAPR